MADTGMIAMGLLNCLLLLVALQGPPPGGVFEEAMPAPLPGTPLSDVLQARLAEPMRAHNWQRVEEILAGEIARQPGARDLLVQLGRIFLLDNKPLNSAVALLKAEKLGPLDANTRFILAMAFAAIERADLARPYLEKLHKESPSNPNYLYWLGRLDFESQHFAEAAAKYKAITESDPEFVKAWDGLGLSSEGLGKFLEAEGYYRRAVEQNRRQSKPSAWPPFNFGSMLLGLGRLEEAEPLLREAIMDDPQFARAHFKYGVLHGEQGDLEKALSELERAAALDSGDAQPFPALIRIYHKLGRTADEARAATEFQRRKAQAAKRKSPN